MPMVTGGKYPDDVVARIRNTSIKFISTNAWDIFKNSDVIAKYHNKSLLLDMAECYFYIDAAQELMNEYYEEKRKATHTIFELYTVHPHEYLDVLMKNKASKYFLERIVILDDYPIPHHFSMFIDLIDYILYLIDKDGDYNEETIKKDSDIPDFESFRKLLGRESQSREY